MIFQFSGYVGLVAAFVIIGLICDFFGTFLTGLGLRSTDPNKKYKYYRVAIYALVVARESLHHHSLSMKDQIFESIYLLCGFLIS